MSSKFVILLDGGFVLKKLETKLSRPVVADDILSECNKIISHKALCDYELLRVYFYHAPPATDRIINPIDKSQIELSKTPHFKQSKQLLDTLELEPNFALRLGETVIRGWKLGNSALKSLARTPRQLAGNDLVPDIKQKGVDLRIGLDIARLSLRQLVDVIVVVTGDSDVVPAFKFARREGIRVYLYHMGHGVHRDLKAHVDLILES